MFRRICKQALIGLGLTFLSGAMIAHAHHSAASVDQSKVLTVSGTLKDFDFSAPHAQITVVSADASGNVTETKVATLSPAALINQGFKPKDFNSGDKVEMSYHPNRNGVGGIMVTLKLGDGRIVKGDLY